MPTSNPRLSVTLTPESAAILSQLSRATGNSQSAIVAELLEAGMPTLSKMVRVIEAARTVAEDGRAKIVQGMEDAQNRLHEQLGIANDLFDAQALPLLEEAEAIQRRSRRAAGAEGPPLAGRDRPGRASAKRKDPPYLTGGSGFDPSNKEQRRGPLKKSVRKS